MAMVNGKLCSVATLEEYKGKESLYDPQYTVIQIDDNIYPLIPKNSKDVGVYYKEGMLASFYNPPVTEEDKNEYSSSKITDYTKAESMRELMQKQDTIRSLEREILTNANNIFTPRISDKDSAEMKGFKEAVIKKGIDKAAYAPRLGPNAANDLRLFNDSEITLKKMKKIAKAFDMKVTMIFEDNNPDVPNPIGGPIVVEVTGGE